MRRTTFEPHQKAPIRKQDTQKQSKDHIYGFSLLAIVCVIFVYVMIFYVVPADRRNVLKKQQVEEAAIRAPEVFAEMVEELRKIRETLEKIAMKIV